MSYLSIDHNKNISRSSAMGARIRTMALITIWRPLDLLDFIDELCPRWGVNQMDRFVHLQQYNGIISESRIKSL